MNGQTDDELRRARIRRPRRAIPVDTIGGSAGHGTGTRAIDLSEVDV